MRVSFDTQIFSAQQVGGISRYFSSLANEMSTMQGVQPSIVAPLHINDYLERLPAGLVRGLKLRGVSRASQLVRVTSILSCDLLQCLARPDIVHRTYYYPAPWTPRGARTLLTV